MATGPIETHLHRSINWENGAPGPQEGPRGRSANCGNGLFAQCVRLRSEINRLIKPFLPLAITALIGIGFLFGMSARSNEKSEKIEADNRKKTIIENNRQKTLLLEDLNASEAKNLNKMRAKLQESESLLNDFYSVGLIYPKYRSLIPMASISEYFEAGRCSTLGEANNIFEMERKLGTIIDKLDIVI